MTAWNSRARSSLRRSMSFLRVREVLFAPALGAPAVTFVLSLSFDLFFDISSTRAFFGLRCWNSNPGACDWWTADVWAKQSLTSWLGIEWHTPGAKESAEEKR